MEYIGQKINRLTILQDVGRDKHSHKLVEVQCSCEDKTIFIARLRSVIDGNTTSCWCFNKEKRFESKKKYNTYDLTGEYGIGYTFKGEEFYFDLEDYAKIKDICWYINYGYVNNITLGRFHRLILDLKDDEIVDHINLNRKDNRKENLRIVNKSQNAMNVKGYGKMAKFGLKGISWNKNWNKWHNQIQKGNKHIYSKYFENILDAINDKIEFEKEYFGEYRYAWENDIKLEELLEYEKEIKNNT